MIRHGTFGDLMADGDRHSSSHHPRTNSHSIKMSFYTLPPFLIQPLRTPLLAIAIPVTLGSLSGLPTFRVVKGAWYSVSTSAHLHLSICSKYHPIQAMYQPPFTPPRQAFGIVWPILYGCEKRSSQTFPVETNKVHVRSYGICSTPCCEITRREL